MQVDALDKLREWILKEGPSYGEIKPTLVIHNKIVVDVYINRGDERIHLKPRDTIETNSYKEKPKI